MRRLAALALALVASGAGAADGVSQYAFKAFLDDRPIGAHTFTVTTEGARRTVTSDAAFDVRILGITAYRYRHHAEEQWAGDCLTGLSTSTDDDGKPASARLVRTGEMNEITANGARRSEPGCLMTYAYWNPALREQTRLLDPQTGRVDAVKVERAGSGRVRVGGQDIVATDWRITGGESPIDVWISEQGAWVGLDSMVSHGRHRLSYRLP